MSRFVLPVAVIGMATAGVSLVGAVAGATLLGLSAVYLLFAVTLAFTSGSLAYYSVTTA